ncbi:SURF1 family protein [Agromyces seonyuensis]|uniref:SURF1-like protein n=1 Tax=Agromyces seonyuensis TaxID=2662446 RepID=A0A6I4NWA8_9MICO|nr:SURF1 family protein [Agromyces seonyuensis]MWB98421.1 SURF1 family protein [Agromyces seonyuensis]
MDDVRAVFSRRWLPWLAAVVVFAIACCFLGVWQVNRRVEALTEIARIDANYDHDPVPVDEVLPDPAAFDVASKWLPVELTGQYLADEQLAVRNRPLSGTVGYEVITPFRTSDGTVFFVDRGWIPRDESGVLGVIPDPPAGTVTIAARLKADEGAISGRSGTDRTLASVDLQDAASRFADPSYTAAYGILVHTDADDASADAPLALPRPERNEGPHLSYALQWFVYAIMGFVAIWWFARRERLLAEELAAESGEPTGTVLVDPLAGRGASRSLRSTPKAMKRRDADADLEDEILDRR